MPDRVEPQRLSKQLPLIREWSPQQSEHPATLQVGAAVVTANARNAPEFDDWCPQIIGRAIVLAAGSLKLVAFLEWHSIFSCSFKSLKRGANNSRSHLPDKFMIIYHETRLEARRRQPKAPARGQE